MFMLCGREMEETDIMAARTANTFDKWAFVAKSIR